MKSEDIFLERIAWIVFNDKRPFSYKDFLSFECDGQEYKLSMGSIRNIFSKDKDIEFELIGLFDISEERCVMCVMYVMHFLKKILRTIYCWHR